VLTGAGDKAFIAGADIAEFAERTAIQQREVMLDRSLFNAIDGFPKPIIAMVNGYCLGGGCEVALACDMRIASDKASFGQPEINLGIIPGGGGTQRLTCLGRRQSHGDDSAARSLAPIMPLRLGW
jgi:enoyl-CoA hydratase